MYNSCTFPPVLFLCPHKSFYYVSIIDIIRSGCLSSQEIFSFTFLALLFRLLKWRAYWLLLYTWCLWITLLLTGQGSLIFCLLAGSPPIGLFCTKYHAFFDKVWNGFDFESYCYAVLCSTQVITNDMYVADIANIFFNEYSSVICVQYLSSYFMASFVTSH